MPLPLQEKRANKNKLYAACRQWRSRVIQLRYDHLRKASIPHPTMTTPVAKTGSQPPPPRPSPPMSSLPRRELREIAVCLKPDAVPRGTTLFFEFCGSEPVPAACCPFILVVQGSVAISFPSSAKSTHARMRQSKGTAAAGMWIPEHAPLTFCCVRGRGCLLVA